MATESAVAQRLANLRSAMAEQNYAALIVPRADEYLGEYIPERNERLRWLTGFTGSAGAAVVLAERAALFVDGRYTVQVRSQVDGAAFEYHHLLDEPPIDWLIGQLSDGARVACDPRLHSYRWYRDARDKLAAAGCQLCADSNNLIDQCWYDRPADAPLPAMLLPQQFTGETSTDKRARIAHEITARGCEAALIFAPDSVSWLLNVRGMDMPQLPVLLSSALLYASGELDLLVDPARVPPDLPGHVGAGVRVHQPQHFTALIAGLAGKKVLADPVTANAWMQLALLDAGAELVAGDDPVLLPKARKSAVELDGARAAHVRDAVAEVQFLAWLDGEVEAGRLHDEAALSDKLFSLRKQGQYFHATSFDTISASAANAALCHYNHLNGEPAALKMDSVYLCDSGGQYLDGTTDITRTVAIGDPGDQVRRLFTLVLKGHIALDQARFPEGTTGMQLDTLARQYLWAEGFDFDHGTGHGVGAFLSVHEGPQRISKVSNVALAPGMILSNEPGYYREDAFGIRCENLLVVRELSNDGGEVPMLGFECLTLVPFDNRLVDRVLLSAQEVAWLDSYHARVAATIGPYLEGDDATWLAHATQPIGA